MFDSVLGTFQGQYGPYAFGVAAVLLFWFTIIRPEVRANRDERRSAERSAKLFYQATAAIERTAVLLRECVDDILKRDAVRGGA